MEQGLFMLIVFIGLMGIICYQIYIHRKEREELIRALISHNAIEYSESKLIEKPKKIKPREENLIPLADLSEEDFNKYIVNNDANQK